MATIINTSIMMAIGRKPQLGLCLKIKKLKMYVILSGSEVSSRETWSELL